jgi:uncharacterized protein (TIGR00251 family)
MIPIGSRTDGATLAVRVIPRARRDAVAGERDGALLVRVAAPPVEGAANRRVEALLADAFDLPKGRVRVVSGETARAKVVLLAGVTTAEARDLVARVLDAAAK